VRDVVRRSSEVALLSGEKERLFWEILEINWERTRLLDSGLLGRNCLIGRLPYSGHCVR
jgi:hypothetical protein